MMKKTFKEDLGPLSFMRIRAGFTIIEALLGFLIFAIIMVVLYSTFFSGMKIEERSTGEGVIYHQVKMSFDAMGRELEESAHFDFSSFAPGLMSFVGTSEEVSFLIPGKEGLQHIRYYLKDKKKVKIFKTLIGKRSEKNIAVTNVITKEDPLACLMRSEQSFADFVSGRQVPEDNEEILFDNVRRDSFKIFYAYLESKGERTYLVWRDSWDKDYVPSGIKIDATLISPQKDVLPIVVKKTIYIPTGFWGEAL
jgi:hypothetical protein